MWTSASGLESLGLLALDLQGRLYLDLFFSGDFSFELSTLSQVRVGFTGGGGAGPFIAGLPCLGDPSLVVPEVEGARVDCWLVSEHTESGDLHTGNKSVLCSTSVCNIGFEISRFRRLLRSILDFLGKELYFAGLSFSLLPPLSATVSEGVRLTLEMSLEIPDLSTVSWLTFSFLTSAFVLLGESSMRQTCGCAATAGGCVDHVGVIILPRFSSVFECG